MGDEYIATAMSTSQCLNRERGSQAEKPRIQAVTERRL